MPATVDCPALERWQALLFGEVLPEDLACYERHLAICSNCQHLLDQAEDCRDIWRQVGQRIGDPTSAPADPTLAEVLRKLHEAKGLDRPSPPAFDDLYFLRPTDRPFGMHFAKVGP